MIKFLNTSPKSSDRSRGGSSLTTWKQQRNNRKISLGCPSRTTMRLEPVLAARTANPTCCTGSFRWPFRSSLCPGTKRPILCCIRQDFLLDVEMVTRWLRLVWAKQRTLRIYPFRGHVRFAASIDRFSNGIYQISCVKKNVFFVLRRFRFYLRRSGRHLKTKFETPLWLNGKAAPY